MTEARRRIEFFWVNNRKVISDAINTTLPGLTFSHGSAKSCYQSTDKDTKLLFMKIEKESTRHQIQGFLGLTRMDDLPAIDNLGKESPLELNPTEGLLEKSHFLLMPYAINGKKGFAVVFEYNHFGPRISRFGEYLLKKLNVQKLEISRFIRKDILKEVEKSNILRSFQLKFSKHLFDREDDRKFNSLNNLFNSMKEYRGEYYNITISAGREKSSLISVKNLLSDVVKKIQNSNGESTIHCAKVKFFNEETSKMDLVNLLQANISQEVSITKKDPKHRSVISESMYSALEEAYNEKKEALNDTDQVVIWGGDDDDQGVDEENS